MLRYQPHIHFFNLVKKLLFLALLYAAPSGVLVGNELLLDDIELEPIPHATVVESLWQPYYSQILAELENDLLHENRSRTVRNTLQYGYSFMKLEKGDFSYTPIPPFLQELGDRISEALGYPQEEFDNVIISIYDEGYHLEPHVDTSPINHPRRLYYFGERILGIVIEADPTGHLYFVEHEGRGIPPVDRPVVYEMEEVPGTIFSLEGDYRHAPYYHGVSPVSSRRISITFRTVISKL